MNYYLSLDAGGSKCAALIFDDELRLCTAAQTGGVNTTQNKPENSRRNMEECIDSLIAQCGAQRIARAYLSLVGPLAVLREVISARLNVDEWIVMSEPVAGLWAGLMQPEGIYALAGTGSDMFWITSEAPDGRRMTVGAWGPILGDQGSGTWIGQTALRAAIAAREGWGEDTMLFPLVKERWGFERDFDLVSVVHGAPAPFAKVAQATRLVGEACEQGDAVAKRIVHDAGVLMARQTICLIQRDGARGDIVAGGGAWKTHPDMFKAFKQTLLEFDARLIVHKPFFDPVMAGVVRVATERMSRPEAVEMLSGRMPQYAFKW